jgi:hypothetical protein
MLTNVDDEMLRQRARSLRILDWLVRPRPPSWPGG